MDETILQTKIFKVDKDVDDLSTYPQIAAAVNLLNKNEIVAFPTETVYGLGGNIYSDLAIEKIFKAKGRPSDNPLIIHVGNIDQVKLIGKEISDKAYKLMAQFWPGPLTLIFKRKDKRISPLVTAGLDTVAVRMPDHPIALALIKKANSPIAAPSANRSGKPSPTRADHVNADLKGKIAAIIDGGETGLGIESTVVDCTVDPPVILRPGSISQEQLEAVIGEVALDQALLTTGLAPKSPGMKYRHYAPTAELYLVDGPPNFIQQLVNENRQQGKKVGVLTTIDRETIYESDLVLCSGHRDHLQSVASNLFATLRKFDESEVDIIFSEMFPEEGIGSAIMNRLLKAASNRRIKFENNK